MSVQIIYKRGLVWVLAFAFTGFAHAQAVNQPLLPNTVSCTLVQNQVCVDSTPCKTVASGGNQYQVCLVGVPLPNSSSTNTTESCWEYQSTYTCLQKTDDCLNLRSTTGCVEQAGSPTCSNDANGNPMVDPRFGCTAKTHTFKCSNTKGSGGSGTANTNCTTTASVAGLTWSTSSPSSQGDFVLAVMSREIQNQTGSEIRRGMSLFKGEVDKCVIKIGGLKNCCDGDSGNQGSGSNFDIAQTAGVTVGGAALSYGAQYASYQGSAFVYDTLVNNGAQAMASSWASTVGLQTVGQTVGTDGVVTNFGSAAAFGGGVGVMGFGTTAASAAGMAGTIGGSAVTSSTMALTSNGTWVAASTLAESGGSAVLYFNPYALALAVAIMVVTQVVMSYLSCDQDSQKTVNLKSKGICHYIGSYCSSKMNLGFTTVCLETSQSYCCYNGLLAKDIEEGAHAQLGGTWGSPENPVCGVFDPATPDAGNMGLSPNLLVNLDLNAIDLTDFAAQVSANTGTLGGGDMQLMQGSAATKLTK